MRAKLWIVLALFALVLVAGRGLAAYHHEGESDAANFLSVYPEAAGTKLDHCALCHTGGSYEKSEDNWVSLGSCQWCHYSYGYDGSGNIVETLNSYGKDYFIAGRNAAAISAIDVEDSDEDGYANQTEIAARRFPGNAADDPSKTAAPFRVYTRAQLEALGQHTQFMLMITSRSGDFYAQYTGVPVEDLLDYAGSLDTATGITVFAPDGWSTYHPLDQDEDPELYHVRGTYPQASYYYEAAAEAWCDYSAPSCSGRANGDPISVEGGLKMLLAYKREGAYLDVGQLTDENKLDGEGPFRVVPPQKTPSAPDQSSRAADQDVVWPYVYEWDHNAGAASRSATMIRVEPLPEGMTDIDVLEAGWNYVDQGKIVVYGAIDGSDSNGNGILDSEEGGDDLDGDGIVDAEDPDTASFTHAAGGGKVGMRCSAGTFAGVSALTMDDPAMGAGERPALSFPYGAVQFMVTGLTAGDTVTVSLTFPAAVPIDARYFKVAANGDWNEVPFGSNDGDATITLTLTDGDAATDADGVADGTIIDPGVLGVPAAADGSGGGSSGCFLRALGHLTR